MYPIITGTLYNSLKENLIMRIFLFILLTISLVSPAENLRKGTVTAETLRMRSKPNTKSEIIGQLKKGDIIQVIEEKDGWLKIVAPQEVEVWLSAEFIENGVITGDKVNVRAGPNVAYNIVGQLVKGDVVEVMEIKNDIWARIRGTEKLQVWVSGTYVKLEQVEVKVEPVKVEEVKTPDEVARLKEALDQEKSANEAAQRELARLEAEKQAAAQKVEYIEKLLEIEAKKSSKKLSIQILADETLQVGSQAVKQEDLPAYYKAAGEGTVVFIKADPLVKHAKILEVIDILKKENAHVYLEDSDKLLETNVAKIAEDLKKSEEKAEKSYMTLSIKAPNKMFMDTVEIPEEHLQSILKTYGKNFGESSVYIQAEKEVSEDVLKNVMATVQNVGFKVITYPAGSDGHEAILENISFKDDKEEIPLPEGRIRLSGYILEVALTDRHIVDYALAVKMNGEFYAIAFVKGLGKEMQPYLLKEVEVIGVQKRLQGWTRPLIFVESFKPVKEN